MHVEVDDFGAQASLYLHVHLVAGFRQLRCQRQVICRESVVRSEGQDSRQEADQVILLRKHRGRGVGGMGASSAKASLLRWSWEASWAGAAGAAGLWRTTPGWLPRQLSSCHGPEKGFLIQNRGTDILATKAKKEGGRSVQADMNPRRASAAGAGSPVGFTGSDSPRD